MIAETFNTSALRYDTVTHFFYEVDCIGRSVNRGEKKYEVVSYYYNENYDMAITSSGVIVHYYGDGDIDITRCVLHVHHVWIVCGGSFTTRKVNNVYSVNIMRRLVLFYI